jgi:FdhD protein
MAQERHGIPGVQGGYPGRRGKAPSSRRAAWRLEGGQLRRVVEEVAGEWPLTLFVDGEEMVTLVATPRDLEELVVGFLASEGVVAGPGDIRWLAIDAQRSEAWVVTAQGRGRGARMAYTRAVVASCCGKARPSLIWWNDLSTVRRARDLAHPVVEPQVCWDLMGELEKRARDDLFGHTGGVHSALLAWPDGSPVAVRSDIGRHNALDKLYGHTLLKGLDPTGMVVAFSGRLSSEVVLKVAKMGAPVVLSKAAPTTLALDLARRLGMTAVAWVRPSRLTVYTHPQRLGLPLLGGRLAHR